MHDHAGNQKPGSRTVTVVKRGASVSGRDLVNLFFQMVGGNQMIIGQKEFDVWNRTYVMGILDTTPDSFSDGGRYCDREMALQTGGETGV